MCGYGRGWSCHSLHMQQPINCTSQFTFPRPPNPPWPLPVRQIRVASQHHRVAPLYDGILTPKTCPLPHLLGCAMAHPHPFFLVHHPRVPLLCLLCSN